MRNLCRVGLALLTALALSSTIVHAQGTPGALTLNASVGPSFANIGTTFATTAGLSYGVTDRMWLVGEFGAMPHAPFSEAADVAAPITTPLATPRHVNAYHWNGNVRIRPFFTSRVEPYLTGGLGVFNTSTALRHQFLASGVGDQGRITNFATNLGAGLHYRVTDWVGLAADYRTFFVHRDASTPRVNRLIAGLTFSIK